MSQLRSVKYFDNGGCYTPDDYHIFKLRTTVKATGKRHYGCFK
jgi:hypothetical protein